MSINVQDVIRTHTTWDDRTPTVHYKTVKKDDVTKEYTGLFIAFEGGEGSGKSTQARLLTEGLHLHEIPTIRTREPGGTDAGAEMRRILLRKEGQPIAGRAEVLLFAADRADHVEKIIRPSLISGYVVVCDRYAASTLAYQGHAGGLDEAAVRGLSEWASGGLMPDITIFLDIDPEIGLERAKRVERTRFEDKTVEYHQKVREGYLKQRDDSWFTISAEENAKLSAERIAEKILDHVLHVWHVLSRYRKDVLCVPQAYVPSDAIWTKKTTSESDPETVTQPKHYECPQCKRKLAPAEGAGVSVLVCPSKYHGWMDFPKGSASAGVWHPMSTLPKPKINIGSCGEIGCIEHPAEDLADVAMKTAVAPRVEQLRA